MNMQRFCGEEVVLEPKERTELCVECQQLEWRRIERDKKVRQRKNVPPDRDNHNL